MPLSTVSEGDPHAQAHNDEREKINELEEELSGKISGTGISNNVLITETAYAALSAPIADTLYVIVAD